MNRIKIAGIIEESIVDGPGIRLVIFTQGCTHNCIGCHNPGSHDFNEGQWMDIDHILEIIQENPLLDGITFSGGEPFQQALACSIIAKRAKGLGLNILTYTGYIFEELVDNMYKVPGIENFLLETDILIDGRFELEKKNLLLKFRGSENQRIIDVKKSLYHNGIIEMDI